MENNEYIMSLEEQIIIKDYIKDCYSKNLFTNNGYNRWRGVINDLLDVPECIWRIKNKIVELENLQDAPQDPHFKDSIGYIRPTGSLHYHSDPNTDGLIHVRYNVCVQLPEKGGETFYGKQEILIEERKYVVCRAGLDYHYTNIIIGEKERIMLSYGFLLPYERVVDIRYNIVGIDETKSLIFNENNL